MLTVTLAPPRTSSTGAVLLIHSTALPVEEELMVTLPPNSMRFTSANSCDGELPFWVRVKVESTTTLVP